MSGKQKSRRSFTLEEDQMLSTLVEKYGDKCNWKKIAQKMQNRDARQCRDRWNHYLSPYNNSSEWKIEEDQLLMKLYDENGRKWSSFKSQFPGRTAVNIKSRWYKLNQKILNSSKPQKSNMMILNNYRFKSSQLFVYPTSNQVIPTFNNNNVIITNYSQVAITNLVMTPKSMISNASHNIMCTIDSHMISEKKENFTKIEGNDDISQKNTSIFALNDSKNADNCIFQQTFNDISPINSFDDDSIDFFEPDLQSFFF